MTEVNENEAIETEATEETTETEATETEATEETTETEATETEATEETTETEATETEATEETTETEATETEATEIMEDTGQVVTPAKFSKSIEMKGSVSFKSLDPHVAWMEMAANENFVGNRRFEVPAGNFPKDFDQSRYEVTGEYVIKVTIQEK